MTETSRTVFLSYASQNAQATRKICEALQACGIEVWFDQSELRGGDAWDRKIRSQIHECALFLPIISAQSDARQEGYFRREWRLAVERAADMSERVPFLVPIVIDDTSEYRADVPERFREVHWTRLPDGETPPAFVERIQRLVAPAAAHVPALDCEARHAVSPAAEPKKVFTSASRAKRGLSVAAAIVILGALSYLAMERLRISKSSGLSATAVANSAPAAFNPPPHSIAVLPFLNLSGDKDQEYFSEGLTEELLNSLTEINGLQVSGRISAFSFQARDEDLGRIARKLNVGAILEGSVRRSGHTIRVTAELINAVTGFEMWSKSYDREFGDVLKLQTDIATAVAYPLKVTLLGDAGARIELGGTRNLAAFDAYLRGSMAYRSKGDIAKDLSTAIAAYTEAVRIDPGYALAFSGRSFAFSGYASEATTAAARRQYYEKAKADARRAIALAPELAPAHAALAFVYEQRVDFIGARQEYERALELAPGDAQVLRASALSAALIGNLDVGIAAARRAVVLDPLARSSYGMLGETLFVARRFRQAAAAFTEAISLNPDYTESYGQVGLAFYGLGDYARARTSCESHRDDWVSQWCLALVYHKLGRQADAEAALKAIRSRFGDAMAYTYAQIYAQWGDRTKALGSLDTAMRLRDQGLEWLKTDFLFDPLRSDPRFQAIERALRFPD